MIKQENISFDHCIKCTVCTIYCPVAQVTHLFPGPKQSGPDCERLRIKNPGLVDVSLKYCTNCKRCEISCPSDVRVADIIQNAKWKYTRSHFKPRDFMLSRMDVLGKLFRPFSPVINFFMGLRIVRFFLELFTGITSGQTFPKFSRESFSSWLSKTAPDQSQFPEQAVYFTGCSVDNMDQGPGKDLVKILNAMNIGITAPEHKCCGVPAIANSNVKHARKNADYNIKSLVKATRGTDKKIVLTCSSGAFALKYEYANFLEMDNSEIFNRIDYVTHFLEEQFESGKTLKLKPVSIRAAYHSPCHLERMGGVIHSIDILKRIPGLDLVILNSECCGISGTYGFKKEYFEISKAIGSKLFSLIDQAEPEIVVTDCVTCKWQIENFTSYRVVHPITLLAMAIDENGENNLKKL